MGAIEIKQFTGGLDVRRLPETTPGGVLMKAEDGHINRGGEFEQRPAFVTEYDLPAGTFGLAANRVGLVVFGSDPAPTMPAGITYQRLQHPSGLDMRKLLSWDLFQSKVYAVAQFEDGSVYHFYDGVRVADWYDGRARVSFDVTGGQDIPPVAATGGFLVTGGSTGSLADLQVNGISIISAPVPFNTTKSQTATDIAAAINSFVTAPDYTAVAYGAAVVITAVTAGTGSNGMVVYPITSGDLTLAYVADMGGGQDGNTSVFTDVRVAGISIISAPVAWAGTNEDTAAALAAEINSTLSTPEYTATSNGATVTIAATVAGAAQNAYKVAVNTQYGMTFSPNSGLILSGGADTGGAQAEGGFTVATGAGDATHTPTFSVTVNAIVLTLDAVTWNTDAATTAADIAAAIAAHSLVSGVTATASGATVTLRTTLDVDTLNGFPPVITVVGAAIATPITDIITMTGGKNDAYTPGTFVKTVRSKMYATAGSLLHFSAITDPTQWSPDVTGAGFADFSAENSGAEDLVALARYLNQLVVFSKTVTFIEFVDPDPALNTLSQVLDNTGTIAPRSVTQFGDADVFYLDSSGLRSLRARFASTVAATTDIGVPVDDAITAKVALLSDEDLANVVGLINPVDKRFWLILKDQAYVFSFFEAAKVSAWTVYNMTQTAAEGDAPTQFYVTDATTYAGRVWLRDGNGRVYSCGGRSGGMTYDYTQAVVWLPMLSADDPSTTKHWTGLDLAIRGQWEVRAAMDPNDESTEDVLVRVYETSYNGMKLTFNHASTHIGLRFFSSGGERCVLSAATVRFTKDAEDEN